MKILPSCLLAGLLLMPQTLGAQDMDALFQGEKIDFAIKKIGLTAGTAELHYKGRVKKEGIDAVLIVFRADGLNFFDEEKIFADPQTLFPMRVERDLNIFGKREKIIEDYNAKDGVIRITKYVKGKSSTQTIKRNKQIDNIYCFIYRYRRTGQFKVGDNFEINLPTQNVRISLESKEKLKVAGQVYDAFYMNSNPKKYRVWFADNSAKIPLRIQGAVGFGNTSLVMTSYNM